jgi:hypothetical protein
VRPGDLHQLDADVAIMLDAWPVIETSILGKAEAGEGKNPFLGDETRILAEALRRAMRVEVHPHDGGVKYVVVFDVTSRVGMHSGKYVRAHLDKLEQIAKRHARPQSRRWLTEPAAVPPEKPAGGKICPRVMAPPQDPDSWPWEAYLADIPEPAVFPAPAWWRPMRIERPEEGR